MAVLWLLWGSVGVGGAAPSATGQASVAVIKPLIIVMTEELEFGQIRSGNSDGTVTVSPQNVRTADGGASLSAVNNHNKIFHHRAKFEVEGPPNSFFNITLASTAAEHDHGSNPNLQITDLTSFSATLNSDITLTMTGKTDEDGEDHIYVGGTLQVPAGAKNGKYEGDVTISINF